MRRVLDGLLSKKIASLRKPYGFDSPDWIDSLLNEIEAIQLEWKNYKETFGIGTSIDELSKDQFDLNHDKKWKAIFLYGYSFYNTNEIVHFPRTVDFIRKHEKSITLTMFSTTVPSKHIPAHQGNNHGVLRLQIGLDIPNPEKCVLRVEDKKVNLKEKEIFIFDDTFEHELKNDSDANRTVLIIDYYKPLPFFYSILNKRKIRQISKSDYIQSVLTKMKIDI